MTMSPQVKSALGLVVTIGLLALHRFAPLQADGIVQDLLLLLVVASSVFTTLHATRASLILQDLLDALEQSTPLLPVPTSHPAVLAARRFAARVTITTGMVLALGAVGGLMVEETACHATSDQTEATLLDGANDGVCVLRLIFSGVTDPDQLVTCGALTYKLVAQIIDDALTQRGQLDGALAAASSAWTTEQISQLQNVRTIVVTKIAAQQGGK